MNSNMSCKTFCFFNLKIGYMCKYTENFSIFDFIMTWGQKINNSIP